MSQSDFASACGEVPDEGAPQSSSPVPEETHEDDCWADTPLEIQKTMLSQQRQRQQQRHKALPPRIAKGHII